PPPPPSHPFPTRRSSDLMLLADQPDQPLSADDIATLPLSVQTRDAVLRSVVSDASFVDDPARGTPAGGQPSYVAAAIALNATLEDRKSTRLNSSHGSTSY